jgi:hypothetical protein
MELKAMYDELFSSITEIDEKLDSLSDGKTAGKRSLINGYITATVDNHEKIVTQFVDQLNNLPDEVMVGIYYGIVRGLEKNFAERASTFVDDQVKNIPQPTPLIAADEVPAFSKLRSDIYQKLKAIKNLAETFGEGEDWDMPKKRTGSKGPRGKRALSFFTWEIDDKKFDKLAEVVDLYDQYDKVSDLTAAMRAADLNLRNPEGNLEFTLPDGKILVGINGAEDVDDDSDEESSDDDE